MITGLDLYELIEECKIHYSKVPYFSKKLCKFLSQVDPQFDEFSELYIVKELIRKSDIFESKECCMQNFFDRLVIQMAHSVIPYVGYFDLSETILRDARSKYLLEGERKINIDSQVLTLSDGIPNSINDNPAFEINEYKVWMKKGEPHREGGAAEIFGADMFWFKNGMKHNSTGPAVMISNRSHKEWWYLGKKYTISEWLNIISSKELKIALLNSDNF